MKAHQLLHELTECLRTLKLCREYYRRSGPHALWKITDDLITQIEKNHQVKPTSKSADGKKDLE